MCIFLYIKELNSLLYKWKKKKSIKILTIKLWLLPKWCFFIPFFGVARLLPALPWASTKSCWMLAAKCSPQVLLYLATDAKLMMFSYWNLLKGHSPPIKLFWFPIANSDLKEGIWADKLLLVSVARGRNEVMQLMQLIQGATEASGRGSVMVNNYSEKNYWNYWCIIVWVHCIWLFGEFCSKHTLLILLC